jgi:bifunctional oligoribonuclease and PAP phosphatase NrnA
MSDYQYNVTLAQAAAVVDAAKTVLITTHAKPDGDAYGSVVAAAEALRLLGKSVTALVIPPVPASFATLRGSGGVGLFTAATPTRAGTDIGQPDLVLVLDTGTWPQLLPMKPVLAPLIDRMLIVDHHLTGEVPAKWRYVDATAGACCQIVDQWLAHWPTRDLYTPAVCEALFVGLASDTGWFRFSNTTAAAHEMAARLLHRGVDQADLYQKLEQNERPEKLALLSRALASLQLLAGGKAALMVLRAEDFRATGAHLEETEQFVDLPRLIGSVQVVALVTQPPAKSGARKTILSGGGAGGSDISSPAVATVGGPGGAGVRLSFRSKPGPAAVDVSKLAQQFGGGGHARAAGAKVDGTLDAVLNQLTSALTGLFDVSN